MLYDFGMTHLSQNAFSAARKGAGFSVSFEVFPARTPEALHDLQSTAAELATFSPEFISVTYGAGGTTRSATVETLKGLRDGSGQALSGTNVAGHLTCVGASRTQTDAMIEAYAGLGVKHVVALRGDAPAGQDRYEPHPGGYPNAAGLVEALARRGGFDISVAAYPETHPDSPSRRHDLDNLHAKLDAGAHRALTQFCFDNQAFYRLRDDCAARGLAQPLVPGILLIHDFAKVCNFAGKCGASIPGWLKARFAGLENDLPAQQLVAVSVAAEQVLDLAGQGVRQFHFYTLNRPDLAIAVCRCLGVQPHIKQAQAA